MSAATVLSQWREKILDQPLSWVAAPYFDNKPGFDKSMNGLFGISTKEDKNGFLYINPGTDPKIVKSIPPQGVATGKLIKITPDLTNQAVNDFGPSGIIPPATGVAKFFPTFFATANARLDIFPLTVVHTVSGSNCWYQLTYNPISATKTSVRCDVYSAKSSGSPQLDKTTRENLEQEVKQRIQGLEAEHKKVTTFGYDVVSTSHYQEKIASVVENHIKQERLRGCEIKPAEVKAQPNDQITARAESLCAAIECGDKKLDW
ncbi:dioxygenase subunit alpha yeaW [Fusarium beomiforme]|uniref:Dioxygenase subunit alpha yeaW n=1 Tax=Fusarium beomiforme TaxID=44412 RepID=A0A9P5A4T8_9HYPO|nr:dioxygenase subunit alpha yeaW [Fusarium beomiforme]